MAIAIIMTFLNKKNMILRFGDILETYGYWHDNRPSYFKSRKKIKMVLAMTEAVKVF